MLCSVISSQLTFCLFYFNALDQSAVDASSINAFKKSLEKVRSNGMGFFMD